MNDDIYREYEEMKRLGIDEVGSRPGYYGQPAGDGLFSLLFSLIGGVAFRLVFGLLRFLVWKVPKALLKMIFSRS